MLNLSKTDQDAFQIHHTLRRIYRMSDLNQAYQEIQKLTLVIQKTTLVDVDMQSLSDDALKAITTTFSKYLKRYLTKIEMINFNSKDPTKFFNQATKDLDIITKTLQTYQKKPYPLLALSNKFVVHETYKPIYLTHNIITRLGHVLWTKYVPKDGIKIPEAQAISQDRLFLHNHLKTNDKLVQCLKTFLHAKGTYLKYLRNCKNTKHLIKDGHNLMPKNNHKGIAFGSQIRDWKHTTLKDRNYFYQHDDNALFKYDYSKHPKLYSKKSHIKLATLNDLYQETNLYVKNILSAEYDEKHRHFYDNID